MLTRMNDCGAPLGVSRKDALIGAGLTLGAALVVAAIMLIGHNSVTETIGLVMFPCTVPLAQTRSASPEEKRRCS